MNQDANYDMSNAGKTPDVSYWPSIACGSGPVLAVLMGTVKTWTAMCSTGKDCLG